ncbi:hypothetical protein IWZ03DRAFT_383925 [Phyllosticta citriasiana]|uniref:Secreted protein n=1 Tax=Phyllosticta citriasiana TaxID=595635 RepID=A0ABR1KIM6_9PEZI
MQGAGAFSSPHHHHFRVLCPNLLFCPTCFFCSFSFFSSSSSSSSSSSFPMHQSHHLRILLARVRKKHGLLRYTATPCIPAVDLPVQSAFRGANGRGEQTSHLLPVSPVCPSVRCPRAFSFFVLVPLSTDVIRHYHRSSVTRHQTPSLLSLTVIPLAVTREIRPCPCSALVILCIHCERSPWCCVGSVLPRIPHPPAM